MPYSCNYILVINTGAKLHVFSLKFIGEFYFLLLCRIRNQFCISAAFVAMGRLNLGSNAKDPQGKLKRAIAA